MVASIVELLNVPKELSLEFLCTFARLEYALKRAGYLRGHETRVYPDWDRFAREVGALDAAVLTATLECCRYLQGHPPNKQVLRNGKLDSAPSGRSLGSPVEDILLSVRTVRNNLFHGGKFPEGPVAEPLRDQQLIQDCLAVLKSLVDLLAELPGPIGEVAKYFRPGQ